MAALTANRALMRDLNRHLVLSLIKNQGPISRADVAAHSGLAQGTVTNITRDLIEAGLVRETASGPSTGGRPPIFLEIDPGGGHALGLKLMGDRTIMALVDETLRRHLDIKIFVDTDDDVRFIRRLSRDVKERGRSMQSVIDQWLDVVRLMHREFIEPSKRFADLIIPEGGFNKVAIEVIVARIRDTLDNAAH